MCSSRLTKQLGVAALEEAVKLARPLLHLEQRGRGVALDEGLRGGSGLRDVGCALDELQGATVGGVGGEGALLSVRRSKGAPRTSKEPYSKAGPPDSLVLCLLMPF